MARLRKTDPEDVSFTDESRLSRPGTQTTTSKPAARSSPRKKAATTYRERTGFSESDSEGEATLQPKNSAKISSAGNGKQRRLTPLQSASLSKPLQLQPLLLPTSEESTALEERKCNKSLFSRKLPSPAVKKKKTPTPPASEESGPEDETVEVEVEESVWCGSDASSDSDEDELPSPRKFLRFRDKPPAKRETQKADVLDDGLDLVRRLGGINLDAKQDPSLEQEPARKNLADLPNDASRPGTSSSKENDAATLRFSPPRLQHSPPKDLPVRPVTPPQSPSKSRLQSPSKTKPRVPSPKIRQSLDAFWNAETVNEWNDQYSPRKVLKSPTKKFQPGAEEPSSPTAASSPQKSPTKRTRAEREARQAFEDSKHHLAEAFLTELDEKITSGRIRALAASTGGVKFIWSKTLNSTAGRANWRRETSKIRTLDTSSGKETESVVKHHASIELASKVIQDEHRLLNVLAHEYCHLANFMISGIKDQPHGRQFQVWARKVTHAFADRGIEVTTKHSYEIEYKYVWRCSGAECESEFKRHSKSIDPKRQTCGRCRSRLVQIKPTPRGGKNDGGGGGAGGNGGYAAFVKEHFAAVKRGLPAGASQKEVMEAVGRKYRAEKAGARRLGDEEPAEWPDRNGTVDKLAHGIEVIELEDD